MNISLSGSLNVKEIKLLYAIEVYESVRKGAQITRWSRGYLQSLNLNEYLFFQTITLPKYICLKWKYVNNDYIVFYHFDWGEPPHPLRCLCHTCGYQVPAQNQTPFEQSACLIMASLHQPSFLVSSESAERSLSLLILL